MAKAKAQRKSRRGTGRPHYAPEVKAQAIALATSYGNAERAARELGLPPQTVRRWLATPNEQTR
ncbi:MAG TPA: helix-turn-helix domain-containing protein, partial [Longimicrobiales bacterium]